MILKHKITGCSVYYKLTIAEVLKSYVTTQLSRLGSKMRPRLDDCKDQDRSVRMAPECHFGPFWRPGYARTRWEAYSAPPEPLTALKLLAPLALDPRQAPRLTPSAFGDRVFWLFFSHSNTARPRPRPQH